MKTNLPVIDEEVQVESGMSIVSKTDLRGVITYVNDAFVSISGFSTDELIGKSHNIVRHPDMPPQAFADMWRTLKSGQPWKGVVKNRRKDGRYYWVDACVVPIRKEGETIGYMSVRQRAKPADIAKATALYERLNATGAALPQQKLKNLLTIRAGFLLGSLFVIAMMIAGGILGLGGLRLSNSSVETMYRELLNPVSSVGRVSFLLADTRSAWLEGKGALALAKPGAGGRIKDANVAGVIAGNRGEIDRLMVQISSRALSESDRRSLEVFQSKYKQLAERVLIPLEESLMVGADVERFSQLTSRAGPLFREANEASIALEHSLLSSASHNYEDMLSRNGLIWMIAVAGILFGVTMVIVVGRVFLRDIVQPLDEAILAFDRIAQGDLTNDVNIYGKGETGQLIRASATMQLHLRVMMDELTLVTNRLYAYCRYLNHSLLDVSQHSEAQHDRVYQAKDAVDMAAQEAASVSLEVEQLLTALNDVKAALPAGDSPVQQPLEKLESQIANLATTLRVQAFAADEVANKMHQIASLIVESRQQTQEAYGISEQVRTVADELKTLVAYFETRKADEFEWKSDFLEHSAI